MLNDIIKKGAKCYFISPHLDDVALSCGQLLTELKGKTENTVINVFTEADNGPYTLSARRFLSFSPHVSSISELYKARQNEDEIALSQLGVKVINLGFVEALFRKKINYNFWGKLIPEFRHVYPTYKKHIMGEISKKDTALQDLKRKLRTIVPEDGIVFAPYNIAGHVDHLIVRKACEEVFDNVIFYSEFPYNIRNHNYGYDVYSKRIDLTVNKEEKTKILSLYRSQFKGLFHGKIVPDHKEVYFVKKV